MFLVSALVFDPNLKNVSQFLVVRMKLSHIFLLWTWKFVGFHGCSIMFHPNFANVSPFLVLMTNVCDMFWVCTSIFLVFLGSSIDFGPNFTKRSQTIGCYHETLSHLLGLYLNFSRVFGILSTFSPTFHERLPFWWNDSLVLCVLSNRCSTLLCFPQYFSYLSPPFSCVSC